MEEYNTFLNWLVAECPEPFKDLPNFIEDSKLDQGHFSTESIEDPESEVLWIRESQLRQFWDKSFYWGFDSRQFQIARLLLKLDRSREEIDLLKIEMKRFGQFLIRQFELVTGEDSVLRTRRNWHEYINDTLTAVLAFLKHAQRLGSDQMAQELRGKCSKAVSSIRRLCLMNHRHMESD